MKFLPEKKYIQWGLIALGVIIGGLCFYYLLFHGSRFGAAIKRISQIAMPISYGVIFAYLLTPVVNSIEKKILLPLINKLKINFTKKGKGKGAIRVISIILTLILVALFIYSFFSLVIPQIIRSLKSIIFQFPYFINIITVWVNTFLADNPDIKTLAMDILDQYSVEINNYLNTTIVPQMEMIVKSVSISLLGIFKVLWNLMIGTIISCYVLYNKETFAGQAKKVVYAIFNTKTANLIIKDMRFTSKTFIGFVNGKIIDSIIIGVLCFIFTNLMATPYALLVSVIMGVTNVIPFFGPYLGAIPSALLILLVNPTKCLYFIIFIFILQQIDGNILEPKILGGSTGLTGFWIIFSITIFGGVFGVPGMIIGVPIFAVFYAGFKMMINRLLHKKGLSYQTVDYLNVGSIINNEFIAYEPEHKKKFFSRNQGGQFKDTADWSSEKQVKTVERPSKESRNTVKHDQIKEERRG